MHIRKARIDEAQAILDLHARTVREVNSRDYTPDEITAWLGRQRVEKIAARIGSGEIYVCCDDADAPVGFARRKGDRIAGLYVAPDCQGCGVGSMLLAQLESDALGAGIEALELNSTLTAVGFYQRHGYEWIAKTTCFTVGEHALAAVAMRKQIGKHTGSRGPNGGPVS